MANYNNTLQYDKQIKFTGKGYNDPKAMPVPNKATLDNITIANDAFEGMERVVLSDETQEGKTTKYRFSNNTWIIESQDIEITGDDVE